MQVVGRLATQVARLLTGKNKPTYVPTIDCGDHVVIVNARHVRFSGRKGKEKLYHWHSGFAGGLKTRTAREMFERKPEKIIREAVFGMLPRQKFRVKSWAKKLRVFPDRHHDFAPQLRESAERLPEYIEYCRPTSKEIQRGRDVVSFEDDVFSSTDPADWDLASLETKRADHGEEFAEEFRQAWALELEHWAQRDLQVPEYIYTLHGLPYPGDDKPSLTPEEAKDAWLADLRAYEAERDKEEPKDVTKWAEWARKEVTDQADQFLDGKTDERV